MIANRELILVFLKKLLIMAKYDNLLEQDLFELFGQEFMEKVIKEEHGKYLTEENKEKVFFNIS